MLELLQATAELPIDQPATTADTLRTIGDGIITLAAVRYGGAALLRGVTAWSLPEDMGDVDPAVERDPMATALMAAFYALAVALTTVAVYLLASLPWALLWAGVGCLVAALVALRAAQDATPWGYLRLLAEARRGRE